MTDIEKSNINIIIPGTGCCRSELLAARGPLYDIQRFGINIVTIPEEADIMVVSGFIGEANINRFLETYERIRRPGWVFASGTCAISGSRLCGSPALLKKLKSQIHIDMYIPGCPPRPEAFIFALIRFISNNIEIHPTGKKDV
jgi:NADH-quinone oxidoreductase subunit B